MAGLEEDGVQYMACGKEAKMKNRMKNQGQANMEFRSSLYF